MRRALTGIALRAFQQWTFCVMPLHNSFSCNRHSCKVALEKVTLELTHSPLALILQHVQHKGRGEVAHHGREQVHCGGLALVGVTTQLHVEGYGKAAVQDAQQDEKEAHVLSREESIEQARHWRSMHGGDGVEGWGCISSREPQRCATSWKA
eukprot:1141018-Pelagomonas_calceolata.AAC.1